MKYFQNNNYKNYKFPKIAHRHIQKPCYRPLPPPWKIQKVKPKLKVDKSQVVYVEDILKQLTLMHKLKENIIEKNTNRIFKDENT